MKICILWLIVWFLNVYVNCCFSLLDFDGGYVRILKYKKRQIKNLSLFLYGLNPMPDLLWENFYGLFF